MTFNDIFKNRFLEEFSAVTVGDLLIAVGLAFVLGLFIVAVYRLTYAGAMFSKSFALCLVLLSMVTSLVILAVSSNVVLSLGMVGALSIVRFRTAVKEPIDTVFMFWAIAVGIITGAGYIPIAVIATLLIGVLFLGLTLAGVRFGAGSYLLVLRYDQAREEALLEALHGKLKYRVKSKNVTADFCELVLETRLSPAAAEKAGEFAALPGVTEANLLSYTGSTTL